MFFDKKRKSIENTGKTGVENAVENVYNYLKI